MSASARSSPARPWAKLKALLCLIAGSAVAAGILLAVPVGFDRALERPSIAALSPATIEGMFIVALFGLLAAVAILGARLSGQRFSAGNAPMPSLVVGLALGLLGVGAALMLATIAGVTRSGDLVPAAFVSLLLGALLVLFQAVVEEVYFRGWLQPVLIAGWGRWAGIAAAAAAFALLHLINTAFSAVDLANLLLTGICFGLLAERSGGVLLPIGIHFGWTWAEAGLFGTTPNPGIGSFGSLYNYDLFGPVWWGGSNGGLSASLGASFVLCAIIAATLAWPWPDAAARRRRAWLTAQAWDS